MFFLFNFVFYFVMGLVSDSSHFLLFVLVMGLFSDKFISTLSLLSGNGLGF